MNSLEQIIKDFPEIIGSEGEAELLFVIRISFQGKAAEIPILAADRGEVIYQVISTLLNFREGMTQIHLVRQTEPYEINASAPGEDLSITIFREA